MRATSAVAIGGSEQLRIDKAILVYRGLGQRSAFATVHDIVGRELGPGEPATMVFLAELAKALGQDLAPEILPENVIARTPHLVAWWTVAQVRTFFYREKSEMGTLNGKLLPVPALVWRLVGGELHVRALWASARPQADTRLYIAPFWNTSERGLVCQGTMARPEQSSVAQLDKWVDAYFGSEFTHEYGNRRLTTHRSGFAALWTEIALEVSSFPVRYLTDAKQTLLQFLTLAGSDDA